MGLMEKPCLGLRERGEYLVNALLSRAVSTVSMRLFLFIGFLGGEGRPVWYCLRLSHVVASSLVSFFFLLSFYLSRT
jgi:hypothetical protein